MDPGFPALVSKSLPSCVCDYLYYVGFVWMRFNTLNRHDSDIVDSVARGRKVFRNQGGRIRFSNARPMLVNTTSEELRRLSHVLKPTFTTGNQIDNMLRVARKVRVTDNEVLPARQRTLES